MAELPAATQFEDFIVGIGRARMYGRLTDDMARQICAGLNDPLPDLPPADDEGDLIKVELVIRLARAFGRGMLTAARMEEFLRPLSEARAPAASYFPPVLMTSPPPVSPPERRDSVGPEIFIESSSEDLGGEDEPLASEDDVMDVDEGEVTTVERETDTDPPPSADS